MEKQQEVTSAQPVRSCLFQETPFTCTRGQNTRTEFIYASFDREYCQTRNVKEVHKHDEGSTIILNTVISLK